MKKIVGLLMILLLGTSLSAFEFVSSSKAMIVGANVNVGHGVGVAGHFELPPYGDLAFLKFIPGFGMDLQIGVNKGFFVQNAVCVRVKPVDTLPLIAKAGAGFGIRFGGNGLYIPIIIGADYFVTEKIAAMTVLTFNGDGPWLTLGAGLGFGFNKEEK